MIVPIVKLKKLSFPYAISIFLNIQSPENENLFIPDLPVVEFGVSERETDKTSCIIRLYDSAILTNNCTT